MVRTVYNNQWFNAGGFHRSGNHRKTGHRFSALGGRIAQDYQETHAVVCRSMDHLDHLDAHAGFDGCVLGGFAGYAMTREE